MNQTTMSLQTVFLPEKRGTCATKEKEKEKIPITHVIEYQE